MANLKITLCCNGGVSTKALVKKIVDAANEAGFPEIECDAYGSAAVDSHVAGSDVLLVGPQIKYMAKSLQQKYPDIPVEVISMQDYGQMNGKKIFNDLCAKYEWKKGE